VPYSHLVTIAQVKPTYEGVKEILERNGQLKGLSPEWEENLKVNVLAVRSWVKDYAPDEFVFAIQESLPKVELDEKEKELLRKLSACLAEGDWAAEKLHSTIHETGKALGLDAARTFGAVYKVILGKQKGPRMGYFLQSLKKDWVLERLKAGAG
jgi:lysyl-tRNA synthetase class 1